MRTAILIAAIIISSHIGDISEDMLSGYIDFIIIALIWDVIDSFNRWLKK